MLCKQLNNRVIRKKGQNEIKTKADIKKIKRLQHQTPFAIFSDHAMLNPQLL